MAAKIGTRLRSQISPLHDSYLYFQRCLQNRRVYRKTINQFPSANHQLKALYKQTALVKNQSKDLVLSCLIACKTSIVSALRQLKPSYLKSVIGQTSVVISGSLFLVLAAKDKMSNTVADAISKADELYSDDKLDEVRTVLLEHKDSKNPELLWRLARICRRLSQIKEKSKEERKELTYEGLEHAKEALAVGEDVSACHKWYGIMLSEVGDYEGNKNKIENSPTMKKHFLKAIELCPTDATSHYLLGMWCFSFADLAWYERKIAAVVFGTPPESTYEEALAHFEEAEKITPGFYSQNLLMIAKCYIALNKKDIAKEWLQKLLAYKVKTEDDREAVKKAEVMLK